MRKTCMVAVILSACVFSNSATAASEAWTCSAPANRMNAYEYNGGDTAYINLKEYRSGHHYAVQKLSPKKVRGTTADGTVFTCDLK